jgi:hypothetical protein
LDIGSITYAVRPSTSVQLRTSAASRSPGAAGAEQQSGSRAGQSRFGQSRFGQSWVGRSSADRAQRRPWRSPKRAAAGNSRTFAPRRRIDRPSAGPLRSSHCAATTRPARSACRRGRTSASLRPVETATRRRLSGPFRRRVCGSAPGARPRTTSEGRNAQDRSADPLRRGQSRARHPRAARTGGAGPMGARAVGR